MTDDQSSYDPLRVTFGFVLDSGDGPTILRPRGVDPRSFFGCVALVLIGAAAVVLASILYFGPLGGLTSLQTISLAAVIGLIALGSYGTLFLGMAWMQMQGSNEGRGGPLLIIDHAVRVVRTPRSDKEWPFKSLAAIRRRFFWVRSEYDGEALPYVELSLVTRTDKREVCTPFIRTPIATFKLARRPDRITLLAQRLADELGVSIRDFHDT